VYDAITTRYTFPCPSRGEAAVRLSSFRALERLEGASRPSVYHVSFECTCGEEHPGLVAHDDLDWAPLGLQDVPFLNLMTDRLELVEAEFADLAVHSLLAGEWPWTFFCYPEERPRPVFPSSFRLLAPGTPSGSLGLAVRCPACSRVSVNLVSHEHVNLPFHNDTEIGVVEHLFGDDVVRTLEEFSAQLWSSEFDARRLHL
jgi:hypothetical protein